METKAAIKSFSENKVIDNSNTFLSFTLPINKSEDIPVRFSIDRDISINVRW